MTKRELLEALAKLNVPDDAKLYIANDGDSETPLKELALVNLYDKHGEPFACLQATD